MELARLTLNIANAGVRRDIADPYQMHSTLARAFAPDAHTPPDRFLWRLENARPDQAPTLLVQSDGGGRWSEFERNNPGWIRHVDVREWDPALALSAGRQVVFRVRCNPTVTRAGKRLGLWAERDQRDWFLRQASRNGLTDIDLRQLAGQRLIGCRRKGSGASITVCAVQFDGTATIAEPAAIAAAVRQGIGHAKMMGLGLLSLAPLV